MHFFRNFSRRQTAIYAWPARRFLRGQWARQYPVLCFAATTLAIIATAVVIGSNISILLGFGLSLGICLSFSILDQQVHRSKRAVIEGQLDIANAELIDIHLEFLLLVYLVLLVSLAMVLQQSAYLTAGELFHSPPAGVSQWLLYILDMMCESLLFDIPEIYGLHFTSIEHRGFWGGTVVLLSRLLILVLALKTVLRLYYLRQWMWENVAMLDKYPQVAQARLLLLVQMYPRYLYRLAAICHYRELSASVREVLLETLGKTGRDEASDTFAYYLQNGSSLSQKLAALRGFELLRKGNLPLVMACLRDAEGSAEERIQLQSQSCRTLGSWTDGESLLQLCRIAREDSQMIIRHAAIEALREYHRVGAIPDLLEIMQDRDRHKDERFKAKDALVAIGAYTPEVAGLQKTLLDSPYVDNRRFAAIVLGGVAARKSLGVLLEALPKEEDADARVHIARAIGQIARQARREENTGDPQLWKDAIKVLVDATEDAHPFVRVASLQALGMLSWFIVTHPEIQSDIYQCIKSCNTAADVQTMDAAADLWEKLSHVLGARYSLEVHPVEATACLPDDSMPTYHGEGTLLDPEQRTVDHSELFFEESNTIVQIPSRYEFLHPISHGRLSHIYKVRDKQDGRHKALKQLHWEQGQELFFKEIEVASHLNHPNIIPILEVYRKTKPPCFTMPYLPNPILSVEMQHRKSQAEQWSRDDFHATFASLCDVVTYLHSKNIVHLDLKPANLFYQDPQIVLFDFNIAQHRSPDRRIALPPRERRGTPFYMAPEQYYGGELDFATDIYALAVIAYELLVQHLPFGIDPLALYRQRRTDMPEAVFTVLARAGHADIQQRYHSVEEFWQALEQAMTSR